VNKDRRQHSGRGRGESTKARFMGLSAFVRELLPTDPNVPLGA